MSETPETEHPAAAPPPPPPPPAAAPSQPAPAASEPVTAPSHPVNTKPVYQRRAFQLTAVGVVGLLLGCLAGLGIGLVSGLVVGSHGRGDVTRSQHWGPGDGYRQPPNRKQVPGGPFAPQLPQKRQQVPASPGPVEPSQQAG